MKLNTDMKTANSCVCFVKQLKEPHLGYICVFSLISYMIVNIVSIRLNVKKPQTFLLKSTLEFQQYSAAENNFIRNTKTQ